MYTVGLTGGIGSGKSAVCAEFTTLGITVIDADIIARDLLAPNTALSQAVIAKFGPSVQEAPGVVAREALRRKIFTDSDAKAWLEAKTHPLVRASMDTAVAQATSPYCIVCIPLLFENNLQHKYNRILVVDTTVALQKSRTLARDQSDSKTVARIIDQQCTRAERLQMADDILDNSGLWADTQAAIGELHAQYLKFANKAL